MMFTIGSGRTRRRRGAARGGSPFEIAAARATAIETASTAFAPSADLSSVPSSAIEEGVDLRLIERVSTDERGADRLADVRTAPRTPSPAKRSGSPSRSSLASWRPVEVPAGTLARAKLPSLSSRSTSTVGRPPESRISRAQDTGDRRCHADLPSR